MATQKNKKTLYLTFAVALTLTLTAAGCGKKKEEAISQEDVEKILIPVKAAVAANRDVTQTLNFSGNIDAFRRAAIAPALQGARVLRIYVDEGHSVKEGQLLARMEDFQLQSMAAQLAQLEADHKRISALYSRGSVTAQQFDQINSGYIAAKAGYEQLKNSVELRAPFGGTVIGRYANEGELYTGVPGADGSSGVLAIAQLGRMKIEVMVPEQDFVLLRVGQNASVRVDAYPGQVFEGKIFTVNPALNRMSRTSRVVIEIKNDKQLLKPGMFARVEIVTNSLKNVLAVPSTAILTRSGERHVFTIEDNPAPFVTTPKLTPVKIGLVTSDLTQVVDGVDAGVVVLTDNNVSLSENTKIRVTDVVGGRAVQAVPTVQVGE